MSRPEERQGYIGDITTKSLNELKELLDRKEKLLTNRSLLQKLPDQGKKAQEYVDKLKELIEKKNEENDAIMDVSGNVAAITRQSVKDHVTEANMLTLKDEKPRQDVQKLSAAISNPSSVAPNSLSDHFQNMSIGKKIDISHIDQQSTNSYEKIIQRDNDFMTNKNVAQEFVPNKSVKSKSSKNEAAHPKTAKSRKEESAVYPPQYKHQSSKLISLTESIQLTQEQERRR